ncbi:unnamed protein product [Orchesella dallaii]|uniref:Uncharacterized protein n=1 Tax=Orchesella dallaii TaxID=48710 RepID=A0ABP1PP71_9HEXA
MVFNRSLNFLCFNSNFKTKSADIFSLGCVYYFVLTWGKHPFGLPLRRNANILVSKGKFDELEKEHEGFSWLLSSMTSKTIDKRPPASEILQHHIFWTKEKSLNFLVNISNRTKTPSVRLDNCITSLEARIKLFHDKSDTWLPSLCPVLRNHLTVKFGKKQKASTVMDLIRLIRNMHNHISEEVVPSELKKAMGVSSSDFFDYWITRFPYIVAVTWIAFRPLKKQQDYGLVDYYSEFNFEFGTFKK